MMNSLTFLIALITAAQTAQAWNCWLPDGIAFDNKGMVPCNATIADAPIGSACCDPRDSCSTSGLCLGASGANYRGGCTAQDWDSPNCASECRTDPILKTAYSKAAFLWNCGTAGLFSNRFCCGSYANPEQSCCTSAFTFSGSGIAFKPGRDLEIQRLSSVTVSPTSVGTARTQTPTTAPEAGGASEMNVGLAIGVGLGVPLSLLVLGILCFLIWKEKKRHERAEAKVMGDEYTSKGDIYTWHNASANNKSVPWYYNKQLPDPQSQISQLDGVTVYEVEGSRR